MTTILKGQFFKEIVATKDTVVEWGWTVLWVESGGDGSGGPGRVVAIRNDVRSASPRWFRFSEAVKKVESGDWLPTDAPLKGAVFPGLVASLKDRSTESLPERKKHILREQDRRMEMIRQAIELGRDAFCEKPRTEALKAAAKKWRVSVVTVRRYLCLYWQFGFRPEGLRPRWTLAGQKSLAKRLALYEQGDGKVTFKAYKPGTKPSKESEPGTIMGAREIKLCRKGARMFLFKESPDHALRYSWVRAHLETINLFFGRKDDPSAAAPSLDQFKRAVRTDPDFAKLSQKIIGTLPFARNHRQLKSDGSTRCHGLEMTQ